MPSWDECGNANPEIGVVAKMDKKGLIVDMTQNHLNHCEVDPDLRLKSNAFTRKRKLTAKRILMLLLQRLAYSLQLGVDKLFEHYGEESVSKQAFSKARANLNPEFVRKFADGIAEIHAQDPDAPSWKGMRLIAIDGTDIALENSAELKEKFGCSGSKRNAATALGSMAYGPLDQAIYDCRIAPYATDERELAKLHMDRLLELGLGGSLLLFDRGYPSAAFLARTLTAGFSFVMRVRKKWNLQADAIKDEGWISVSHEGMQFPVRVLKVSLPSGETETLLTNLNESQLPLSQASQLYFKRWAIEIAFDILKSKLQLENFSGKTEVSVRQDFYATIYIAGFAMICAADATKKIVDADQGKNLKYARKANMNRTIAKLRDRFLFIILEENTNLRQVMLDRLCHDIATYSESIRPGRSPVSQITPI